MLKKLKNKKFNKTNRWLQYIVAVLVIISFIFYNGYYYNKTHKDTGAGKTDLVVFYVAGQAIANKIDLEPGDLYKENKMRPVVLATSAFKGGTHFLYMPPAAVLFAPLALGSLNTVAKIWTILSVLIFIGAFYSAIYWLVGDKKIFQWRYTIILFILFFANTTESLIRTGQINSLILALLIFSFAGLFFKKKIISGLSIAVAIIFKIFPIIILPYLVLKKQWRALIYSIISLFFLGLITLPFFSIDQLQHFTTETLPRVAQSKIGYASHSSSLYGCFRSMHENHLFDFVDMKRKAIINVGDDIHLVITAIILLLIIVLLIKNRKYFTKLHAVIDYGLIIGFILLFAKMVHQQYHFWIIPVILLLISLPLKKKYIWMHATAIIALLLTQYGKELPLPYIDDWYLKPQTLGNLLLFTIMILWSTILPKKYPDIIKYFKKENDKS